MSQVVDEDPWLGTLERFPIALHARASLVFDMNTDTLQRTLVHCLCQLQESIGTMELSLSDHPGYLDGTVGFRVGVGNREGCDILDAREEERVLRRIEERGTFPLLDFSLDLHYRVQGPGKHRVQRDRYLTRMSFQQNRVELLLHHLKGLKRVQPDELVHLLLSLVNTELARKGYTEVELETLQTD